MEEKSRDEQISEYISAGVVGAALGKILTGQNEKAVIAGLVGIAATATYNAFKASAKNSPVLIIDDRKIYEVDSHGNRKFIKHLPRIDSKIPDTFKVV